MNNNTLNNTKKIIEGIVKCNKHALNGTLLIEVKTSKYNSYFGKILSKRRLYVVDHEQRTMIPVGEKVSMISCRPISKMKSHKIINIKKEDV